MRTRTITLDNGDVFSLTEDVFFDNYFSEGDDLSEKEIGSLKARNDEWNIRENALRLLSYRKRSRAELVRRISEKGFAIASIQRVLDDLEAKKYLDDADFALSFARDKVRQTKIGPIRLRAELGQHHLAEPVVNKTIDTVYSEYPETELIRELIKKRNVDLGNFEARSKCLRYLLGKGYQTETVYSVINQGD